MSDSSLATLSLVDAHVHLSDVSSYAAYSDDAWLLEGRAGFDVVLRHERWPGGTDRSTYGTYAELEAAVDEAAESLAPDQPHGPFADNVRCANPISDDGQ